MNNHDKIFRHEKV